jgi:hypothetical protein
LLSEYFAVDFVCPHCYSLRTTSRTMNNVLSLDRMRRNI